MDSFPFVGASDLLLLVLLALLVLFFQCRPLLQRFIQRVAPRTSTCLLFFALLPVASRLALLPHHPAPTPEIYDEFSHLLVADTLLHFRLANPPHPLPQFFETFFVLQHPGYSSIYPIGQGAALALGRLLFGHPWAGVLLSDSALCALCYWMLKGWTTPAWSFIGGVLAVFQFGPLNEWTNCYWGGHVSAIAGCLAFGALPRLLSHARKRDAVCLGLGMALQILTRPFESLLLLLGVLLFLVPLLFKGQPEQWRRLVPSALLALLVIAPAAGLTLLQNQRTTGTWTTPPYLLNRFQYGVPTTFSFQPIPIPQRTLTRQQEAEYNAELSFHGEGPESMQKFLLRLEYRLRYARFFLLPPLYLAALAFVFFLRSYRFLWVLFTIALFALGTNFFPYFFPRYIAATLCLFLLVSVAGLQKLSGLMVRALPAGRDAASLILFSCAATFALWYSLHLMENPAAPIGLLRYETWDSIPHESPSRRNLVNHELAHQPGPKLVFVRYRPRHPFQDEWVYNAADLDHAPTIWARDLGDEEDQKLTAYYPGRKTWLLEPDAVPPKLTLYEVKPPSPKPPTAFQDVK